MNRAEEDAREAARVRSDRVHEQRAREKAAAAAADEYRRVVQPLGAVLAEQERQRREDAQVSDEERAAQTAAQRQAAVEVSSANMRRHLGLERQPLDDGEPRGESRVSTDPDVLAALKRMRGRA